MPYLLMLASKEEQQRITKAGYEHVDIREIEDTLDKVMGFAIWLPGDPMDWLVLEEEESGN